ncbi:unnamed protein product [Rotaria sp. Silwood1]|nr:unnamed protein product [Rotaria sp. Silwood1]
MHNETTITSYPEPEISPSVPTIAGIKLASTTATSTTTTSESMATINSTTIESTTMQLPLSSLNESIKTVDSTITISSKITETVTTIPTSTATITPEITNFFLVTIPVTTTAIYTITATSITMFTTTTTSVTNTIPPYCNEISELQLPNCTCASKLDVQMYTVTILRNRTMNATTIAYALSYYFSSIANTNLSLNPSYILSSREIEEYVDSLSKFDSSSMKHVRHSITCLFDLPDEILLCICRYLSSYHILYAFSTPSEPEQRLHLLDSEAPLRPKSLILNNEHVTCSTDYYFIFTPEDVIQSMFDNLKYFTLTDCLAIDL